MPPGLADVDHRMQRARVHELWENSPGKFEGNKERLKSEQLEDGDGRRAGFYREDWMRRMRVVKRGRYFSRSRVGSVICIALLGGMLWAMATHRKRPAEATVPIFHDEPGPVVRTLHLTA